MKRWQKIAVWILIAEAVGIAGEVFTSSAIPTWYVSLNKPWFSPPNWLFGPVWTGLYAMMGAAMGLVDDHLARKLFGIQLTLNFFWSVLFFGLRQPLWAFGEILVLWIAIVLCMRRFLGINKTAGYLLLPYLLWVSFAAILNLAIVVLN